MELRHSRVDNCPPDEVSPGWKIEILDRGKSVSRLWVVDRSMRMRGALIRLGGISTVGTEESHRGRGLAKRVMQAALRLMRREGYHASLLHGIADFYHRFGYVSCMPEYELRLPAASAGKHPGAVPGYRLRAARPDDLPALASLYNRENAGRTGSMLRHPRTWKGFPRSAGWFLKPGIRVVTDRGGRLRGYLVYDAEGPHCRASEAGGAGQGVFTAILSFLARRAKALGQKDISLIFPPDHPLALHCRDLGCSVETRYTANGGFMGRIINPAPFLDALGGTALPRAWLAGLRPDALWELSMGYRSAAQLTAAGRLRPTPARLRALHRAFPPLTAHTWWADRF